jgi:hypothetical protein
MTSSSSSEREKKLRFTIREMLSQTMIADVLMQDAVGARRRRAKKNENATQTGLQQAKQQMSTHNAMLEHNHIESKLQCWRKSVAFFLFFLLLSADNFVAFRFVSRISGSRETHPRDE